MILGVRAERRMLGIGIQYDRIETTDDGIEGIMSKLLLMGVNEIMIDSF